MARQEQQSIMEYFAEHERYRCGYCGSSDTNYSHGLYFVNLLDFMVDLNAVFFCGFLNFQSVVKINNWCIFWDNLLSL